MSVEPIFAVQEWLSLRHNGSPGTQKVYAIATDSKFSWYLDEKLQFCLNKVTLSTIDSAVTEPCSSRPGFVLNLTNGEKFHFICHSIFQVSKWITALGIKASHEVVTPESFDFISYIGEGGNGKVFLAIHRNTGKLHAIKVIDKENIPTEKKLKHVLAERNTLCRAKHPFITRLYYAFQTCHKIYFVLEFVPGGDLRYHLQRRRCFPLETVRLIVAETVLALHTLHSLGIVYRDLKPENILLDSEGHVKLADFGTSRVVQDGTELVSMCGTIEYLSPEMLNHHQQTFSVDWWALGVVTYELLTGSLPFSSKNVFRLTEMISKRDPRMTSVPVAAQSFIKDLLAKNPAERLGTISDVTQHPFFEGIDFKTIAQRGYTPGFVPDFDPENPAANFDEFLTSQPVNAESSSSCGLEYSDDEIGPAINVEGFAYQYDGSSMENICYG